MSPDGRNLYAVATSSRTRDDVEFKRRSDTVTTFSRNPGSGRLRQLPGAGGCLSGVSGVAGCGAVRGVDRLAGLDASPDGRTVYAIASGQYLSEGAGGIARLDRSPASGALRQPAGRAGCVEASGGQGCSRDAALVGATAVLAGPRSDEVHVASSETGVVRSFARRGSGLLAARGCAATRERGCAKLRGDFPDNPVLTSSGRRIYLTGQDSGIATLLRPLGRGGGLRPVGCLGGGFECAGAIRSIGRVTTLGSTLFVVSDRLVTALAPGLNVLERQRAPDRRGRLALPLRCDARSVAACRASVTLTVGDPEDGLPARYGVLRDEVTIARAARGVARFELPPRARRFLESRRGVGASVVLSTEGAGGATVTTSRRLSVPLPPGGFLDAPRPRRCLPPGSEVLLTAPTGRVLRRLDGDDELRAFGCLFAGERLVPLEDNDGDYGAFFRRPAVIAGPFVAFDEYYQSETGPDFESAEYVVVYDLRDGRKVRDECTTESNYCFDARVEQLVLKDNGAVAWVASGQLRKFDAAAKEPVTLDRGSIERASLRLKGSRISWVKRGSRRSASLL